MVLIRVGPVVSSAGIDGLLGDHDRFARWSIPRSRAHSSPLMAAIFFKTPAEFRKWLGRNHARAKELLLASTRR